MRLRDAELSLVYTVKGNLKANSKPPSFEEAGECYRKAVWFDSSSIPALVAMADLHFNQGRSKEADKYYARAHQLNPSSSTLLCKWAQNKRMLKDENGREKMLRKALAENPEDVTACYEIGRLLVLKGEFSQASSYFELAYNYWLRSGRLDFGPPPEAILCNWGISQVMTKDTTKAYELFREARRVAKEAQLKERLSTYMQQASSARSVL